VNSDFKNNRVEDPTKISEKQQKKVKKYCKEFFDKAVIKHRAHEQKKGDKNSQEGKAKKQDAKDDDSKPGSGSPPFGDDPADTKDDDIDHDDDADISDGEMDGKKPPPQGNLEEDEEDRAKRKRDTSNDTDVENREASPVKRQKSSTPLSEKQSSKGLDDDLSHSGFPNSHQSIGVVQ
jgi:hypothetical protein